MTSPNAGPPRAGRVWIWAIIALAVAGIVLYLIIDHWTHLAAAAPYAGIIAIALLHLFGHRGHGDSGRHREQPRHNSTDPPADDTA
ncbi:DUF2933 domain-containing protein [Microbacterium aurantiacum]|uniref:DUF2933 domain-containing protein n=1 Tax=Microbacterium aurantiacum TaxID=162393 RepID=UPI004036857E